MPLARRLCRAACVVALLVLVAWLAACAGPSAAAGDGAAKGPNAALQLGAPSAGAGGTASESELVIPIAADDPVRGNRLAPVTIVVFSDFQCPYCSRLANTLEKVQEIYGEDVRIVFKNAPLSFHAHARLAAEVGNAVFMLKGPEAFWRYHDLAFRRQKQIAPDTIRGWAMAAGTDSRDVEEGLASKKWSAKVERDEAVSKRLGVVGTPASFVNGAAVSGAQPFENFKEVIDVALKDAKALAERGTKPDRIYATALAASFKDPKPPAADEDEDDNPLADATVWKVPVGTSPVRGPADALVTIVEFGDFQCPFCKKIQPTLQRLRSEFGDRIRFVWKDEPLSFHPRAVPAATLARAARAQKGDAAFWTTHDKLFEPQATLAEQELEDIAKSVGLDVPKAMSSVQTRSFAKAIDVDLALADDVQAIGTPHLFINGRRVIGARPFEQIKPVVAAELARAEAMVRGGVKAAAVYDTIMKDAKGAPEPERKTVAASTLPAPFRGAANAKVVIQEFSDFQCPFCGRAEPTIDQLLKDYPGQVKVVWRNLPLPFHDNAELAAEAAREAFTQKGNDGFSRMRELLFKHQREDDGLSRAAIEGYAKEIGLDLPKLAAALDAGTHKAAILADKKAAADANISATPAFVVGTVLVSGAQSLQKFKKAVELTLAEKK